MKIENRQQLLIVLTLAVLAIFVGDKLIFTPLTHLWSARAKEIKKLRQDISDGSSLVRREQFIRTQWDEMRTNTLPQNPSLAQEQVLQAFVNWAQESGATLNGMTPQWKSDSEDYRTLVCRVDAAGSLWTLSRFLYDVEKGPMALKVESVDLSSKDNTGQALALSLQVSGLVLNSSGK